MKNQQPIENDFINTINQIIDDNIGNENFSVADLAKKACLSRSMLHRKLKKYEGISANDYIIKLKLIRAKELLKNDSLTISEIAYQLGFNDPSYFNKVFKKHQKLTPGDYKKLDSKTLAIDRAKNKNIVITHQFSVKKLIIGLIISFVSIGMYFLSNKTSLTEKSIAVLPLNNLTGQSDNNYFVDGLHDALIGELGQFSSLRVISRTSTLKFRDSNMLLQDIANELGVNTIVEGSVTLLGDSLKIIIQLIDVFPKERHLLANEYYDDIQNVLKTQSTAVRDIADKIRINLSEEEEKLLAKDRIINPETYKAYLRGMHHLNHGTEASFEQGIQYLVEAIELDPGDPFAYAGLALGYAIRGHGMIVPAESFRSATAAAQKALIINPRSDEAHTALALIYLYQFWDWEKADKAFKKAIANNPNNDIAHAHYAWYLVLLGEMEKSIHHAKMAVNINPLSSAFQSWLAWLYFDNGEYEQAQYWAKKSLEIQNDNPWGILVLGWTYVENKQYDLAIETHNKLPNRTPRWKWFKCRTYILSGEKDMATALWNEIELEAKKNWVNPYYRGMMAGMLGKTSEAFLLLNEAYENRYYPISYIETVPSSDFIKDDPRYKVLVQKFNLPNDKTLLTLQE